MLKRAESHRCEANTLAKPACSFSKFIKSPQGNFLENCLQNLDGVTDFSQEKFEKQLNMLIIQSDIEKYHCLHTEGAVAS